MAVRPAHGRRRPQSRLRVQGGVRCPAHLQHELAVLTPHEDELSREPVAGAAAAHQEPGGDAHLGAALRGGWEESSGRPPAPRGLVTHTRCPLGPGTVTAPGRGHFQITRASHAWPPAFSRCVCPLEPSLAKVARSSLMCQAVSGCPRLSPWADAACGPTYGPVTQLGAAPHSQGPPSARSMAPDSSQDTDSEPEALLPSAGRSGAAVATGARGRQGPEPSVLLPPRGDRGPRRGLLWPSRRGPQARAAPVAGASGQEGGAVRTDEGGSGG